MVITGTLGENIHISCTWGGFWGGVQKNPRFLRKFQICGLITLLLDIVCLARGVSGGVSLPFLAKNRQNSPLSLTFSGSHFAANFGDSGGVSSSGGRKWSKMAKNGQKWPKMVKNGQKWPFLGGSLGKPPPPPFLRFKSCLKTPVFAKRAIFQDFWIGGGRRGGSIFGHFWPFWGFSRSKLILESKSGQKSGISKVDRNDQNG